MLNCIVACSKRLYSLAATEYTQKDRGSRYPLKRLKQAAKPERYSVNESGYTQLHKAVFNVDKEAVANILSRPPGDLTKAFINHKDKKGYTALQWCLDASILATLTPSRAKDYLYILQYLLKHPQSDLSLLDRCRRSILHWAVITKYVGAVHAILVQASQNETVKMLIKQNDNFGYPALHYLVMDEKDKYTENQKKILELFLDKKDICDINAKDSDHLPLLYWCIKYKQPKLAAKVLVSDQLEPFPQFICNTFRTCYYNTKLSNDTRLFYFQKLSDAIRNILTECMAFLTNPTQADPDITATKKLLVEKYLGLGRYHPPIQTALDILHSIKKTIGFEPENDRISTLQPNTFDVQSNLTATFNPEALDKTVDLILRTGDFDQDISLSPDSKEDDFTKALKDFLEGICETLSLTTCSK